MNLIELHFYDYVSSGFLFIILSGFILCEIYYDNRKKLTRI